MSYCCTTDVVTRRLPPPEKVKYPQIRERLLRLMRDDQQARLSPQFYLNDPAVIARIVKREQLRVQKVLEALETIGSPSARNVGLDGSRAIWLIALHNWDYKDAGKVVLTKMRYLYYKDKRQVFYPGIPYLVDRIMVGARAYDHGAKQLYGTQRWYVRHDDGSEESGIFPIWNPKKLLERRLKFDLAAPGTLKNCQHGGAANG